LEAIKATFKTKSIIIIIEEDDRDFELTTNLKNVLDERLDEGENTYISTNESIELLNKKISLLIIFCDK